MNTLASWRNVAACVFSRLGSWAFMHQSHKLRHFHRGDDNLVLNHILEISPDVVYLYDRLKKRYLSVNSRCVDILGYTPDQILQMDPSDLDQLIHPKDVARAKSLYASQEHLVDNEVLEATYRVRHAHGDYRNLRNRQRVFARTAGGVAKIIIGVGTDITSTVRRQTEVNGLRGELIRSRRLERLRIAARLHDTAVQDVVGAAFLLKNSGGQGRVLADVRLCLSKALRSILDVGLE